jgi:hypothetical protein
MRMDFKKIYKNFMLQRVYKLIYIIYQAYKALLCTSSKETPLEDLMIKSFTMHEVQRTTWVDIYTIYILFQIVFL